MSIKSRIFTAALCATALAGGFSLTAWAASNWCEECHIQCAIEYQTCLNNGQWTEAQCRESYRTCIIYTCNNCIIP
ncbi:hypothetical protein [Luteimonas sp. R10]|uniref:hypothetical protein n=1 Tax=Luteimonas sp. R10 TaxID=3108176 RepID=UPI0030931966|nr:hypothetical protein U3649_09980 [Luteimonas sp. R10]